MAKAETVYRFSINLSHVERGLYESFNLTAALHPSEILLRLSARILAYCYCYDEGISFSRGLSAPDEPAIEVRDLTGRLVHWIDVGQPEKERMEKAIRSVGRVTLFSYGAGYQGWLQKQADYLERAEKLTHIHMAEELLKEMSEKLTRNCEISVTFSDDELYISIGDWSAQQSLIG